MIVEMTTAGIEPVLRSYADTKLGIEQSIPFDADWLHLVIGPMIFVAAALAMRKPAPAWSPWSVVVLLAVLNEGWISR